MTSFKIITPTVEPLGDIPFHCNRDDIIRTVFLDTNKFKESKLSIAIHNVNIESECVNSPQQYTELHTHETDEINILLPDEGHELVYRMQIDDEIKQCAGPCSIYIPAGVPHKAEVVQGKGRFLCIKLTG